MFDGSIAVSHRAQAGAVRTFDHLKVVRIDDVMGCVTGVFTVGDGAVAGSAKVIHVLDESTNAGCFIFGGNFHALVISTNRLIRVGDAVVDIELNHF